MLEKIKFYCTNGNEISEPSLLEEVQAIHFARGFSAEDQENALAFLENAEFLVDYNKPIRALYEYIDNCYYVRLNDTWVFIDSEDKVIEIPPLVALNIKFGC